MNLDDEDEQETSIIIHSVPIHPIIKMDTCQVIDIDIVRTEQVLSQSV